MFVCSVRINNAREAAGNEVVECDGDAAVFVSRRTEDWRFNVGRLSMKN